MVELNDKAIEYLKKTGFSDIVLEVSRFTS